MREASNDRPLRRGVWMFPNAPAPRLVGAVIRAEEVGLDEVWIADEGISREPMTVLAAAARATSRIRLATGITSPLLRHPGALAATAATVDELSGGRFVLGLGLGGDKSLGPFGISTDRPVGVLRDAIETARAVLRGEAGPGYEPDAHAMAAPDVPIWVGARGPQMIRLAARLADGVFLSGCSPQQHDSIAANLRSVDASTAMALYQSASAVSTGPAISSWPEVGEVLAAEADRLEPQAIGINLIDLIEGGADPVEGVERAAEVLHSV